MEHEDVFDIEYYLQHEEGGMACYRELTSTIRLFEFADMYVKQIEPDYPDMVCTQISFYQDTLTIKEKGQYLKHGGVEIGIWKEYDETGNLIESENMDEDYPVIWQQLEEILKDKDISLLTADSIYRNYDEKHDEATWTIILSLPMEKGHLYLFNAKTGEMINEEIIDMSKEI